MDLLSPDSNRFLPCLQPTISQYQQQSVSNTEKPVRDRELCAALHMNLLHTGCSTPIDWMGTHRLEILLRMGVCTTSTKISAIISIGSFPMGTIIQQSVARTLCSFSLRQLGSPICSVKLMMLDSAIAMRPLTWVSTVASPGTIQPLSCSK